MTVVAQRVTVAAVNPVLLSVATETDYSVGSPAFPKTYGQSTIVRNRGAVSVFLGGPGVTALAGFELEPSQDFTADLAGGDALWGITASSTAACHVLQSGI